MHCDLSPLIASHKFDLNQFEPSTVELMRQIADGGLHGLPYANSTMHLLTTKTYTTNSA